MRLLLLYFLGISICAAVAVEPRFGERERTAMLAGLAEQEKTLSGRIEQAPRELELYSRRGDARLFLGRPKEAVADFEKMIALDPATDAPHWRLGVAYYLAGNFAASMRQFAKYHAYDGHDRENGIWKFLAQARAEGLGKARGDMLSYRQFDREPFPSLYELCAGRKTGPEIFAEIAEKGLREDRRVVFFANYYVGLNELLLGDPKSAREHLRQAVEIGFTRAEPDYMWQVARLQSESLNP